MKVAPLALGGNVFGWTADEAASFAVLDAFVDAGGTMIDTADVYSAWVPGHKGGESETVIGQWLKRDPAKRDKVVIATKVGLRARATEAARPSTDRRRRAKRRCSGSGSTRSTFITRIRTTRTCRSPTASARSTSWSKAGKIRAIGALAISPPTGSNEALATCARRGPAAPAALQP